MQPVHQSPAHTTLLNQASTQRLYVQTTSVATATMPLAAGFVGVIPAMGMLSDDEGSPHIFAPWQLILWSLALALFGVFAAIPLREQVIEREQLRFPSGTATAEVIRTLHAAAPSPGRELDTLRAMDKNAGVSASVMAYAGCRSSSVQPFFDRKCSTRADAAECGGLLPAVGPRRRSANSVVASPGRDMRAATVPEHVEMSVSASKGVPDIADVQAYTEVHSAACSHAILACPAA